MYRCLTKRALAIGFAAMLAAGSAALAGCAGESPEQGSAEMSAEGFTRSVAIDDSSSVLDAELDFIYGNLDEVKLGLVLEQGELADSVDPAQLRLDGALSGWTVASAKRVSDTELEVTAQRPEGLANNGASIAYVELAADVVDIPASDEEPEVSDAPLDEMTPAPEGAEVIEADVPADDAAATEAAAEAEAEEPLYHAVSIAFVDPYLTVDYDESKLDGSKLTLAVEAHDYYFGESVSADDFRVDGTDLYSVDSVRRDTPQGLTVVLSLLEDAAKSDSPLSALEGAALVHEGNVTGGEVSCLLTAAEPWVDVAFDFEDADSETIGLEAELYNSDDELADGDVKVTVDDKEVDGVRVESNGEGAYSIVVPSDGVTADSVVSVDVAPVEGVLGQQSDPAPASETMTALDESTARDFDVKEIIISGGKSGLSALAQMGWKQVCKSYLDPTLGTSLYEVTNNELLAEVVKVQQQVADVSTQLKALADAVDIESSERAIDAARSSIEKISSAERYLRGKIDKIQKTSDPAERERLILQLSENQRDSKRIDAIADELPVLYNRLMTPNYSGKGGSNLVEMYDNLLAKSYNWGVQTFPLRGSFRENLALVWAQGAQMVQLAYGANDDGEYADVLNELDEMTRGVDKLINEQCKIDITSFYYYDGIEQDIANGLKETEPKAPQKTWLIEEILSNGSLYDEAWEFTLSDDHYKELLWYRESIQAYEQAKSSYDQALAARVAAASQYCNATGRWYRPLSATDAGKGWSRAQQQNLSNMQGGKRWEAESPFRSFTKSGSTYRGDFDWTSRYMGTEEAKQMAARLRGTATLKQELSDIGFVSARYLITSDRFDTGWKEDVWKMDTFEVANVTNAKDAGFTADKVHFSGRYPAYTNWQTSLQDMFVLRVVTRDK